MDRPLFRCQSSKVGPGTHSIRRNSAPGTEWLLEIGAKIDVVLDRRRVVRVPKPVNCRVVSLISSGIGQFIVCKAKSAWDLPFHHWVFRYPALGPRSMKGTRL